MTEIKMIGNGRLWRVVRWIVWAGAAALLLLPLVAMQFTAEVQWTLSDFIVMGVLLALVGGAYELVVRVAFNTTYVVAWGIAVGTAFVTIWINLAVGIIAGEDNPANGLFFGVVIICMLGALLARLKPMAMSRAMTLTAVAQVLVGVVALATAPGHPEGYVLSAIFSALWLTSAHLFRMAARQHASRPSREAQGTRAD